MDKRITTAAAYLKQLLGNEGFSASETLREINSPKAPEWTKEAAHLYRIPIKGFEIVLAALTPATSFNQAVNLYRVLSKLEIGSILLLADSLPTKSRGVLVRMRIPHVISAGAIYAPDLGIIYKKIPKADKATEVREQLLPTAQKLVAASLLKVGFLKSFVTMTELRSTLVHQKYRVSPSTLSRAFRQLEQFELIQVEGSGPHKRVGFIERELLWSRMLELETETSIKRISVSELPKEKWSWVYSSYSALARLSDLNASSEEETIAMSLSNLKNLKGTKNDLRESGEKQRKFIIEAWRGEPTFLSREKCINVIELVLSLRRTQEPRTQLALSQIIEREGLNPEKLWERK